MSVPKILPSFCKFSKAEEFKSRDVLKLDCVVASNNPVKLLATKHALQLTFPKATIHVEGRNVDSGVPDQPFGDVETLLDAQSRVRALAALSHHTSDLLVGIEGGVAWDQEKNLECFAWVVLRRGAFGKEYKARSASFMLPKRISDLVISGMELGEADNKVFVRKGSGSGSGTIGHLSHGLISRTDYYTHAVTLALIPIVNPDLYV
eukprot:CAMPEP_0196571994 /NCGR_PEP_ID=MMETSP1081-20130531/2118_1 /TAXON_ID=36882 /ORGANISM="Pyramimonas amylifera, Strain CCMP720" /LENGTH=205 /DNA_ID=CAMNT_0041889149 /DNA_START=199 /DNA_END=816 /DNA_ORIENTATION=+